MPLELSPDSPAYTPDGKTTLFTDLADFVRRCQTFEGGLGGKPDTEAHGAYTFCALGCLAILDAPHRIIPKPRTGADQVFDEEDRVATIHPAYTIPEQKAYAMKAYFAAKTGF
ncbi:hypothetical protein BN1723_013866 [Verticillium longisporum]|uniref:Prenyltransferase alpha-alpha toroid domain-containing protein n=1 Tax=Verticillium longisporum TaxID=100787 RepID=A0A0G4LX70_VERLO|nr:hypothetical protein BN1723_013866 [Verticillium longisporum]